jgi:siroheme synthase
VAQVLLAAGWRAATPVAVVFGAGTGEQDVWRGHLAGLQSGTLDRPAGDPPGTIVIGDVVALADVIGVAAANAGADAAPAEERSGDARG